MLLAVLRIRAIFVLIRVRLFKSARSYPDPVPDLDHLLCCKLVKDDMAEKKE
jgi:hypothetical protein